MQNIHDLATAYAKQKSRGELREQKIIYDAILYGWGLKDADPGQEMVGQPVPEHVFIPGNAGKPYIIAPEQPVLAATKAVDGSADTPAEKQTVPQNMAWDAPKDTILPHSGEGVDKPTEVQTQDNKADFPMFTEGTKPVDQAEAQKKDNGPVVEGITGDGKTITAPSQEAAVEDVQEKSAKNTGKTGKK